MPSMSEPYRLETYLDLLGDNTVVEEDRANRSYQTLQQEVGSEAVRDLGDPFRHEEHGEGQDNSDDGADCNVVIE